MAGVDGRDHSRGRGPTETCRRYFTHSYSLYDVLVTFLQTDEKITRNSLFVIASQKLRQVQKLTPDFDFFILFLFIMKRLISLSSTYSW